MTDLERAYAFMEGHISCQLTICSFVTGCGCAAEIADLVAAAHREGAERVLSSLSHPNRSALRENVRENLEQQYANIFGKRCSTDAARRLAECALETTVDFLVRALPPHARGAGMS